MDGGCNRRTGTARIPAEDKVNDDEENEEKLTGQRPIVHTRTSRLHMFHSTASILTHVQTHHCR